MQKIDTVQEIMTQEVIAIQPNDYMIKASKIFEEHDFHHLPVVDKDGRLLGMISKTECCRLEGSLTILNEAKHEKANRRLLESLLAEDVMQEPVVTIAPSATLYQAAMIFRENYFHALPVVDEHNYLVGMLTTYDMINHAYRLPVVG